MLLGDKLELDVTSTRRLTHDKVEVIFIIIHQITAAVVDVVAAVVVDVVVDDSGRGEFVVDEALRRVAFIGEKSKLMCCHPPHGGGGGNESAAYETRMG
jgi:hypothetical protein